jgi:hypothetical protein
VTDAPTLFLGLEFVYSSFWDLSSDRSVGMGTGPIPYSSIIRYADRFNLSSEETEEFAYLLREMDSEFLDYIAQQREKEQASGKKGRRDRK